MISGQKNKEIPNVLNDTNKAEHSVSHIIVFTCGQEAEDEGEKEGQDQNNQRIADEPRWEAAASHFRINATYGGAGPASGAFVFASGVSVDVRVSGTGSGDGAPTGWAITIHLLGPGPVE